MFSNSDLMNDRTNGREFNPDLIMTSKPSRNKYGLLSNGTYETSIDIKTTKEYLEPSLFRKAVEFSSGMMILDGGLKLANAIYSQRRLLANLGLEIDPLSNIKLVYNIDGEIVAAIAYTSSHMGQIKKIRFIDIDPDAINFKKAMCYLCQHFDNDPNYPLKFYNSSEIDIERNRIRSRILHL